MTFTVAIDGPAAAGKGTIARAIAAEFGFSHLDTGLLYRAVARRAMAGGDPVEIAKTLEPADLEHADLRGAEIARKASEVAAIEPVRAALRDYQRRFAGREGGAVLDGRDITTVICPDAEVKLFVTASAEVRAQRRFEELVARGEEISLAQVLEDVRARDARDAGRATSPMLIADDAVVLDTSEMSIKDAVAAAIDLVQTRRSV